MASFFDSFQDFTPAGFLGNIYSSVSGNGNPIDSLWNTAKGDPEGIKKAYDAAMGQNATNTQQLREQLAQGQQKALGYYAPIQSLYQNAYGTGGLKPMGGR